MVYEEVKNLIAEQLNADVSFITPETDFIKDLNADSLDAIEVVLAIEDKYHIEIPDDEAEKFNTVQDIVDFIERRK